MGSSDFVLGKDVHQLVSGSRVYVSIDEEFVVILL
jgi:hypothetical protein